MTSRALPLCAAVLLLASGCLDTERHPTAPEPGALRPAISDASRGGNLHFSFLPPMVPAAAIQGDFDPTVRPRVELCEGPDCVRVIAWAELGGGHNLDALRRDLEDEHYAVNWHTSAFQLDPGKTYRIQVRVAGTRLGFADVRLVERASDAKKVPDGFVPLLLGRTLPIKFRIEKGAVVVISGASGGTVAAEGGGAALALPPGAVDGDVGITIEPVALDPATPEAEGVVPGTAYEFGPHGIQFDRPVTMTIRYDPSKLPGGVGQNTLRLHRLVDGRWIPLAQSRVDVRTGTVTGVTHSFSTYGVLASASVSVGEFHACGIGTSGSTYCWGSDWLATLGDAAMRGEESNWGSNVPVRVEAPAGVAFTMVSTGQRHSCGVGTDGSVYCWGANHVGQSGGPLTSDCLDGWIYYGSELVEAECQRHTPTIVPGGHRFTEVSAGGDSTCGVSEDGKVYCWGWHMSGVVLGPGSAISCGFEPCSPTPLHVPLPDSATSVSISGRHACALTASSIVYCWGQGDFGELGDGSIGRSATPVQVQTPTGEVFTAVRTAWSSTCALTAAGRIYCWGANPDGQLGGASAGTCNSWPCSTVPQQVSGSRTFTALAPYWRRNCALAADGGAYCWGVGIGTLPQRVGGSLTFTSLAVGGGGAGEPQDYVHCGIAADPRNTAYCWGEGSEGQLGNGYWSDSLSPVPVSTPPSP